MPRESFRIPSLSCVKGSSGSNSDDVAEIKEQIVRQVILSDDQAFLGRVAAFISSEQHKMPETKSVDIQAFWNRLTDEYGEVLQKLAQ